MGVLNAERREVQFLIERICQFFYTDPRAHEYASRLPVPVWIYWPPLTDYTTAKRCIKALRHYELTPEGKSQIEAHFGGRIVNRGQRLTICEHMGQVIE